MRLVLVRPDGTVLGATPQIPVATPWWQHAGAVVEAAKEHFGLEVTVLRLVAAEHPRPQGGPVLYLAETSDPVLPPLGRWAAAVEDHPHGMPWARPGGPAQDLAWADAALAALGRARAGAPDQVISWNLSSVWRLPLVDGSTAWLKHVPPFLGHEGAVLEAQQGGPVPQLLARDGARILMAELPGVDLHDAEPPTLERLVDLLVAIQTGWVGRHEALLAMGLPDWRAPALTTAIRDVIDRWRGALGSGDVATLDAFATDLPDRFAAIDAAGLPATLVHGDFHPGNARGPTEVGHKAPALAILDWGDSGVGNPLLDQAAFLDRVPADHVTGVQRRWWAAWRKAVPGADPEAAAALLPPVAAARQAVIYQRFLDGIEPSEHPYHRDDPPEWLVRTAALVREE